MASKRIGIWCGIVVAAALAAAGIVWSKWAAPTSIAFVNYPEYMLAPLMDQEFPSSIKPHALKWTDKSGKELKRYSMVVFFGMGLNFTDEQTSIIKSLRGKPIDTTDSTRKETALNTLTASVYLRPIPRPQSLRTGRLSSTRTARSRSKTPPNISTGTWHTPA